MISPSLITIYHKTKKNKSKKSFLLGNIKKYLIDFNTQIWYYEKKKLSENKSFSDHTAKIDAAQVYTEGDYVFFLLTGESGSGENSEGVAEMLGNEVQRGIDAIKQALGMQ